VTRRRWPKRSSPPTPTPSAAGTSAATRRSRPNSPSTSRPSTTRAGFALIAVEPASRRGAAIARYEPAEQDGTAEVAIAVTPAWRHVGLATELLRMLTQAASERGIHTFTGTYLADNRPVTALITAADEPANRVTSDGIAKFSVRFRPRIEAPGHDPGAPVSSGARLTRPWSG
jgi:RimJ/RimL family protein N-acetyltransferase